MTTFTHRWCITCIALVTAATSLPPHVCGADAELRREFLKTYKKVYDDLIKNYTNIEYRAVRTADMQSIVQIDEFEGKFNLTCQLHRNIGGQMVEKNTNKVLARFDKATIAAANSKYVFEVTPKDDGYLLSDFENTAIGKRVHMFDLILSPIVDWSMSRTYKAIAEDPETEFVSIQDEEQRGVPVKRVSVVVSEMDWSTNSRVRVKKNYFFRPDQGWICCGCTAVWPTDESKYVEEVYEYDGNESYPPLKGMIRTVRDARTHAAVGMVTKTEVTTFKRGVKLTESECRLTAFGLPEPLSVIWSRTPWYLWVALAGIIFLLAGAAFYWLKRRRQAA